ncbi:MAG: ceramidase domain-containing protein [Paracoccaceae bacterium]
MDWSQTIDAYCERTDPSFWSEPINALTNLAFVIAALIMWQRTFGAGRVLAVILLAIGIGSGLFHTVATAWAAAADTAPIIAFALLYIYLANRDFHGWPIWLSALGAAAYIPLTAALTPLFAAIPFIGISSFYWPLPLLIFTYAIWLRRNRELSRNLAIGAAILCLSLTFRSLDKQLCMQIPFGTHFLWHILNAIMLAWMIETWTRFNRPPDAPR